MTATAILIPVKTCKKCGESNFREDGRCRTCQNISSYAWRKANPEKMLESNRRSAEKGKEKKKVSSALHRKKNKEKINSWNTEYRRNNKEKIKIAHAKSYQKHKESAKIYRAKWNEENKERKREMNTAWSKAHPDAKRAHCQNRRARILGDGGKLSIDLAPKLFKLQKGKCPCCGEPLGDDFHMDHKIPLVLGGTNTDDNIQLLRKRCNQQKSMKHPVDFMQERGFLL